MQCMFMQGQKTQNFYGVIGLNLHIFICALQECHQCINQNHTLLLSKENRTSLVNEF